MLFLFYFPFLYTEHELEVGVYKRILNQFGTYVGMMLCLLPCTILDFEKLR